MLMVMRTRTIKPEDLTNALFETHHDGGEIERLRQDVNATRELLAALLQTLTPVQLLAVYVERFDTTNRYVGGSEGTVELTAPGVAR